MNFNDIPWFALAARKGQKKSPNSLGGARSGPREEIDVLKNFTTA
jgi:hypothetical protein